MADVTLNGLRAHHGAHGTFGRIRNWLAARAEYRRTLSELRRLDSRTLDDLGIAPHDIEAVARGRFVRR